MFSIKAFLAAAALAAIATPAAALQDCIFSQDIDHTEIPNDQTILFHMRGGDLYRSVLPNRCLGLRNDSMGFTYEPTPGSNELCGRFMTITLNTSHNVCMMGDFEKLPRPQKRS